MEKVYISGKITGIEAEAANLFKVVEKNLWMSGFEPVNPLELNHDNHDKSWHSYMKADIRALCDCDSIYMLKNWVDSKGAIIEHSIAMMLGIKILYQVNEEKEVKNENS